METCRHFRFQVPREEADELRDADPEACPVCDALPHRRQRAGGSTPPLQIFVHTTHPPVRDNWFNHWLSGMKIGN